MSKVKESVYNAITDTIKNLGFELVEVDYLKKHDGMNLTVYIHSENGISLNDCVLVHKTIDPILDSLDPTEGGRYTLNVSSLGLDRPIKTNADFNRNINKELLVKFYVPQDGKKEICGKLIQNFEDEFEIEVEGQSCKIQKDKAAKVELKLDF